MSLTKMNEETLWETYRPAIECGGVDEFTGFTTENKEMMSRLKFRSIEARIS